MGEALGVICGLSVIVFVFVFIGKIISNNSPQGVKHKKVKIYRFGNFNNVVQKMFSQTKQITSEEFASEFEIPIKNQVEKVGYFKARASFNEINPNPYTLKLEVRIGDYSSTEYSFSTDYLTEEFCNTELSKLKEKIIESTKYKVAYKSKLIR